MTELVPHCSDVAAAPQLVVGRPIGCPRCGRSRVQHGRLSCEQIDDIADRVAYWRRPRWWRW